LKWLIFAILGTIFFSVAGVLDKLLLSRYADDSKAYIICQILTQQIFTIPVIIIARTNFIYPESFYALIFGCFQVIPSFFYMRALQVEEASKVTALEYVYPLFVLLGSVFLLGEVLELKHLVGGLLLVAGTLLISYKNNDSNINSSKGLARFMSLSPAIKHFLSYWILTAIYYLTLKYLLISIDEWDLYIWSSLGSLVAVLPLLGIPSKRHEVTGFFGSGGLAIRALIFEEFFQFLGIIISIYAYASGSVTLVSSIGALQPVITVIIILVMGFRMPRIAKEMNEKLDHKALMQKIPSFVIILVGIYLLS
jgi:uncharacterized membrane protein